MTKSQQINRIFWAAIKLLRGKLYARFALSLIAIGASLFVVNVWELILQLIIVIIKPYYKDLTLPPETTTSVASYIIGGSLVLTGIIIFAWLYRLDERERLEDADRSKRSDITFEDEESYIYFPDHEYERIDPNYIFELKFLLLTGSKAITVIGVDTLRYVEGCVCLMRKPSLIERANNIEHEFCRDYKLLAEPILIGANSSRHFVYSRRAAGPCPGFSPEQLREAEYEFRLDFRFENETSIHSFIRLLRQTSDKLNVIDVLSSPPILNDRLLKRALYKGVISEKQYEKVKEINEENRYKAIRFGESHYRSWPELRYHDAVLRECHDRIFDAQNQGHI